MMVPDLSMSEPYLAAFFILLCAYFIRGITGFGSGLIAIPLLAHFLPLSFVVPMVLVTDSSNFSGGPAAWGNGAVKIAPQLLQRSQSYVHTLAWIGALPTNRTSTLRCRNRTQL